MQRDLLGCCLRRDVNVIYTSENRRSAYFLSLCVLGLLPGYLSSYKFPLINHVISESRRSSVGTVTVQTIVVTNVR